MDRVTEVNKNAVEEQLEKRGSSLEDKRLTTVPWGRAQEEATSVLGREAASLRTAAKLKPEAEQSRAGEVQGRWGHPQPRRGLPELNLWRNYV